MTRQLTNTILLFLLTSFSAVSQDSSTPGRIKLFPTQMFSTINKKAEEVQSKLRQKTENYLARLEQKEKRLYKKLYRKDSLLAIKSFGNIDSVYTALRNTRLKTGGTSNIYSGHLDSVTTALKFLGQSQQVGEELNKSLETCKEVREQLNISNAIKQSLQERQSLLFRRFQKLGMLHHLKGFQKEVYYYSAQISEYKKMLNDPSKMEQKLMEYVTKSWAFKDFFRKNSELGRLFNLPDANGNVSVSGLQTRTQLSQLLTSRFGSAQAVTQTMQQNAQAAQNQLSQLKNRIAQLGSGNYGNGNPEIPDFKPNSQKTKPFLERLECGANIQSQRSRYYFPATTDIGLQLGYKCNDQFSLGFGVSYKIGLGKGWDDVQITHQGIGIRTYLDYLLRKSLHVAGGYEQNYLKEFKTVAQLKNYSAWQTSGLIGLSKHYKLGKKMNGDMKLLWDFLSYRQTPKTQSILFRIGYNLK